MIDAIGHRGAAGLYPENTVGGFLLAQDLGCQAVELDARSSNDGELVVIHDGTVDRTTNGTGSVGSFQLEELRALDAGKGERVPSLREVLEALHGGSMVVQIELKEDRIEQDVCDLVSELGMANRVVCTSFVHRRVFVVKQILPAITTGVLVSCTPVRPLEVLAVACADRLHMHHERINHDLVTEVRAGGAQIVAWGKIIEPAVMDRLIALEVDAIGSDRPDLLVRQLGKHGMRRTQE